MSTTFSPIATADAITSLPIRSAVERGGMTLVVVQRYGLINWSPDGDEGAQEVTLTSDGRSFLSGWHHGPEAGFVYVERWTRGVGLTFHGWIDSVSRQLVQVG